MVLRVRILLFINKSTRLLIGGLASVGEEWELVTEFPGEKEERIALPASIQFGNGRL